MVASSQRQLDGGLSARFPAPTVRSVARLGDYTFREAGHEDLPEIEALFERRGVAPGWAAWKYLDNPAGEAETQSNQKVLARFV